MACWRASLKSFKVTLYLFLNSLGDKISCVTGFRICSTIEMPIHA